MCLFISLIVYFKTFYPPGCVIHGSCCGRDGERGQGQAGHQAHGKHGEPCVCQVSISLFLSLLPPCLPNSFFLSACTPVCLSVDCLCICLSVPAYLPLCQNVCLYVLMSVSLTLCQSECLFVSQSFCHSLCLYSSSVYQSVCLRVSTFDCLYCYFFCVS